MQKSSCRLSPHGASGEYSPLGMRSEVRCEGEHKLEEEVREVHSRQREPQGLCGGKGQRIVKHSLDVS